jgi:hypothetical protein
MKLRDDVAAKEGMVMDTRREPGSRKLHRQTADPPRTEQVASDFRQSVPQDTLLRGSVQAEYRRCGKPTCQCRWGALHGPYFYRYWHEQGRRRKAYVPEQELARVQAAIARYHETFPPLWPIRRALMELGRVARSARATHLRATKGLDS